MSPAPPPPAIPRPPPRRRLPPPPTCAPKGRRAQPLPERGGPVSANLLRCVLRAGGGRGDQPPLPALPAHPKEPGHRRLARGPLPPQGWCWHGNGAAIVGNIDIIVRRSFACRNAPPRLVPTSIASLSPTNPTRHLPTRLAPLQGYTYICADYYGVGRSGGTPEDGCVTRWVRDTIQLLERVADGKVTRRREGGSDTKVRNCTPSQPQRRRMPTQPLLRPSHHSLALALELAFALVPRTVPRLAFGQGGRTLSLLDHAATTEPHTTPHHTATPPRACRTVARLPPTTTTLSIPHTSDRAGGCCGW